MPQRSRRRNILIALAVLVIAILLLLLTRCDAKRPPTASSPPTPDAPAQAPQATAAPTGEPAPDEPAEVLTPATLTAPPSVAAGAAVSVAWSGPNNRGDYVTIVPTTAPPAMHGNYQETQRGTPLELTAPMEAGAHEVRYIAGRSRTILGRAPIDVVPAGATLDAPAEAVLGSPFSVAWTGPKNTGDYITVVAKDAADEHYGNYVNTDKGSPLTLTAPAAAGDAEVRYVAGQGRKVLARRPIRIVMAEIALAAPAEAIAGTTIEVVWTGPNNAGDYITIVPSETPDGRYANYTNTAQGSPLKLLTPVMEGTAELRYMSGQGGRVLSRRPIKIVAARVTLSAPPDSAAGAEVSIAWTGPNNPSDYITIVPKGTPDGQYAAYTNTSSGSPLRVKAPKEAGEAEVRYMAGQGNKVLARIPINIVP